MSAQRSKAASATPDAAEQAAAEQAAAEQAAAEQAAAEGEVRVQMLVAISGTRNGEKWPAVGEAFSLPAEEAAGYIANGYAKPAE